MYYGCNLSGSQVIEMSSGRMRALSLKEGLLFQNDQYKKPLGSFVQLYISIRPRNSAVDFNSMLPRSCSNNPFTCQTCASLDAKTNVDTPRLAMLGQPSKAVLQCSTRYELKTFIQMISSGCIHQLSPRKSYH